MTSVSSGKRLLADSCPSFYEHYRKLHGDSLLDLSAPALSCLLHCNIGGPGLL